MLESIVREVHPNRISFLGGLLTVGGVSLLANPNTDILGAICVAAGQGVDCFDGHLARKYDLATKEGSRLDPLLDKVKNCAIGSYICAKEFYSNNFLLPLCVASNFVVDYVSQRMRGLFRDQIKEACLAVTHPEKCQREDKKLNIDKANIYGKIKAALQNVAGFTYIGEQLYQNHIGEISYENQQSIKYLACFSLAAASVIGSFGLVKRLRLKKQVSTGQLRA